jgi:predicted Rossmann fold nucleotide-binding protein DprA/Smf involved in DNA uptake
MEKIYDIWFADLNIKNQQKLNLLKKYNTKEIFNMDFTELLKNELDENDVIKIMKFKNLDDAEKALNIMETQNIKLFSFKQNEYPNKLQYIDNKPAFIYVRGDYNILDNDSVRYSRM